MLKKRLITAAVLVPIVIVLILWAPLAAFMALAIGGSLAVLWEWQQLQQFKNKWAGWLYFIVSSLLLIPLYFLPWGPQLIPAILFWCVTAIVLVCHPGKLSQFWTSKIAQMVWGWLVVGVAFKSVVVLKTVAGGSWLVLLLVLTWVADSAAYFTGKHFGGRKLAPMLSPNKTWAGVYGAFFFTLLAGLLAAWIMAIPLVQWGLWLVAVAVIVIASIIGDLFISMLKRARKVKDTGTLLPGHGGMLDRMDSLLAAAPIFLLIYQLLQNLA